MASLFKRRAPTDAFDDEETLELVARTGDPPGSAERPASVPASTGRTAKAVVLAWIYDPAQPPTLSMCPTHRYLIIAHRWRFAGCTARHAPRPSRAL